MDFEDWLKKNALRGDKALVTDDLKKSLWTNNVVEYMEKYLQYRFKYMTVSKICDGCNAPFLVNMDMNPYKDNQVSTFQDCPSCKTKNHIWISIKI